MSDNRCADTPEDGPHFNTTNRAWQRFTAVLDEHFDVVRWTTEDGTPKLVSLIDIGTGDIFTVAVLDSLEHHEPHALVTLSTDRAMATHGPFLGEAAAADYAPTLAFTDTTLRATRTIRLHHPDQPAIPADAWVPLPAALAAHAHPTRATARATLLLLDRDRGQLAAVGPFTDPPTADSWYPTPAPDPAADRLVVALHTPRPHTDTAGP